MTRLLLQPDLPFGIRRIDDVLRELLPLMFLADLCWAYEVPFRWGTRVMRERGVPCAVVDGRLAVNVGDFLIAMRNHPVFQRERRAGRAARDCDLRPFDVQKGPPGATNTGRPEVRDARPLEGQSTLRVHLLREGVARG